MARSLRILARFLRICKDLGNAFWGSSLRFLLESLKIFMRIFEDPQRFCKIFTRVKMVWFCSICKIIEVNTPPNCHYKQGTTNHHFHEYQIHVLHCTKHDTREKIMTDLLGLPHVSLRLRRCHMYLQSFARTSMFLSDFPLLYDMIGGVL